MQKIDNLPASAILTPAAPALVELRGPSGRLYGYLDTARLLIEVKRGGQAREQIDLKPYLKAAKLE